MLEVEREKFCFFARFISLSLSFYLELHIEKKYWECGLFISKCAWVMRWIKKKHIAGSGKF